jgi:preprotein translocase subunit SecE
MQQASNLHCPLNVKMRKFINYLKESYAELTKKVSWPSWDKLQNSAIVVMVASVILAILILAIDFCIQHLMTAIYTL